MSAALATTDRRRMWLARGHLKGSPITLLKAEVTGMKWRCYGVRETIVRHRPRRVISAYHYLADIPAVSNYLATLVPNYCFALRHHSPRLTETVLYAWIESP